MFLPSTFFYRSNLTVGIYIAHNVSHRCQIDGVNVLYLNRGLRHENLPLQMRTIQIFIARYLLRQVIFDSYSLVFVQFFFTYLLLALFTLFVIICVWWCQTHIVLCFLFCLSLSCFCVPNFASFSGLSILHLPFCFLYRLLNSNYDNSI